MKNNSDKKLKIVILIMMLLVIMIICLIIVVKNLKTTQNTESLPTMHYYDSQLVTTNTVSDVYKGEIATYKIYNKLRNIFEVYLPDIYTNVYGMDSEELIDFYQSDRSRIKNVIGIETQEEFLEFIEKALAIDCDFVEYEGITYTLGSYKKDGNEETMKFVMKYKNGKDLKCILHINALSTETLNARLEIE